MKFFNLLVLPGLTLGLICFSCKPEIHSEKELYAFLNNPDHGFVVTKSINNVVMSVKYLPGEYLAFKEMKSSQSNKSQADSLLRAYRNTRTFLLTLQPDSSKTGGELMYKGISAYSDYKVRVVELNFNLAQYITLRTSDRIYAPVLTNMENSYNTVNKITFTVVFADDRPDNRLIHADELDFVFTDEIFGTGISHFVFDKRKLDQLPAPSFLSVN
jgi:hypothetical protein